MSFYTRFFDFFVPKSVKEDTKCKIDNGDYEIVIAFNEVGEEDDSSTSQSLIKES